MIDVRMIDLQMGDRCGNMQMSKSADKKNIHLHNILSSAHLESDNLHIISSSAHLKSSHLRIFFSFSH